MNRRSAFTAGILCALLVLLLSLTPAIVKADTASAEGYINTSAVYLRTDPDITSDVITTMYQYDSVVIAETLKGWYGVQFTDDSVTYYGYVGAKYVNLYTNTVDTATQPAATTATEPAAATTAAITTSAVESYSTGYVNYSYLNLRKESSTKSDIVVKLSQNDVVTILEDLDGWYHVSAVHNKVAYEGYVASQYITLNKTSEDPVKQSTVQYGYVNYSYLNLRSKASTKGDLVVKLSQNDIVTILKDLDGWYKVTAIHNHTSYSGYVSSQYITLISDEPAAEDPEPTTVSTITVKPGYVDYSYLNLRKKASTKSDKVIKLSRNDLVLITDSSTKGWYKVTAIHNKKLYSGYVSSDYITKYKKASTTITGTAISTGYVNYKYLNLRSKASTKGTSVVKLSKNDPVIIKEDLDGWYSVTAIHNGTAYSGYVSSSYITLHKAA